MAKPSTALLPQGFEEREELEVFAKRLGSVYSGAVRIDELRYPGLAKAAQNLFKKDPLRYARLALSLMDGISPAAIAARERVNSDLVRFIRSMHPECTAGVKNHLLANLEEASLAFSRRLLKKELAIDKVPEALSKVLDKIQLLTGGVTSRTEHLAAPRPEDLAAMFEALPQAQVVAISENGVKTGSDSSRN